MFRSHVAGLLVLGLLSGRAAAQDKLPVDPFVNDSTVLVARAHVDKLDLTKYFQMMQRLIPNEKEIAAVRMQVTAFQERFLKAGGRDIYFTLIVEKPDAPPVPLLVVPLPAKADADELAKLANFLPGLAARKVDAALLLSDPGNLDRVNQLQPKARPEFAQGFKALADLPVQAVFAPPAALRQVLETMLPMLPKELGGAEITLLTRGVPWAAVGYDTAKLSQRYIIQAKDAGTAKEIAALAGKGLDWLSRAKEVKEYFPEFAKLRGLIDLKLQDDRLTLALESGVLEEALRQAVVKVRLAAARTTSINNMKQIALAFHNHLDSLKSFPARANFDANGKPLLSWRVHILPFVEQEELYKQFKLNEPWDSDHNKKLIDKMPPIYRSPLSKPGQDGKTNYLVPLGKGTMFDGPLGVRIQDIRDGTSNTIMLLEVDDAKAVVWTQPEDLDLAVKDPLAGLARPELKSFHAAFADGSVRTFMGTINLATLRAMFTIAGGEVIGADE